LKGTLNTVETDWDERAALGVVLAAGGYPGDYRKGDVITGLPKSEQADQKVFHAGTQLQGNDIVTSGGRVLCACALGETIKDAQDKAYALTAEIQWDGLYYRTDIGFKAIR
ncbi:MAG TPA: phosphoribosylamine--glycine ligase, partial [Methylococcaceae bacterium]|nr:phosphoribosylamine--glycine ligase [Methylococcaceae bacterium]